MASDLQILANRRHAELRKSLAVERKRLETSDYWYEQNQSTVFPGLPYASRFGPAATSQPIVGATNPLEDLEPGEQPGFQVVAGTRYEDRNVEEEKTKAIKLFSQIMPGPQAERFAEALRNEGEPDSNGVISPNTLYFTIDMWRPLKAEILKTFKGKTDPTVLYSFMLTWLTKKLEYKAPTTFTPAAGAADQADMRLAAANLERETRAFREDAEGRREPSTAPGH